MKVFLWEITKAWTDGGKKKKKTQKSFAQNSHSGTLQAIMNFMATFNFDFFLFVFYTF